MKIVWQNPDSSLAVTTLLVTTDLEAEKTKIASNNPQFTHAGNIEDKDFPNAAQPAVMDGEEGASAMLEVVVEDYFIENGAAVKKPVMDNLRHLRGSWRWDDVNKKVIEEPVLAKAIRASNARAVRNQLLKDSDSLEFRLTGQALADARTYRQELRNLGSAIDANPEDVLFPVRP